jgi:rhamnose utilization protein RhaD (predicted bifunctional aldolase and dehydrogenase)
MNTMRTAISNFCTELGQESFLVQGAGGNVSWKQDDTLWVKGSGTWLGNGNTEDIFVPVDLVAIQTALKNRNLDITPRTLGEHHLKPSIETLLHGIMPQKVVVHLHAINVLRILVRANSRESINQLFNQPTLSGISFAYVPYFKPGFDLANAIYVALQSQSDVDIVFLQNHGIVLGADSIEGIKNLLERVNKACSALEYQLHSTRMPKKTFNCTAPLPPGHALIPCPDPEVQRLALEPSLFKRLKNDWVLYPDHAVFLGAKAMTFTSYEHLAIWQTQYGLPELIFIENTGVYMQADLNQAKQIQLRCYYDVISQISPDADLHPLSQADVEALLNWDAEILRQEMALNKK